VDAADPSRPVLAYVGLGSNLNAPVRQVREALIALARLPETECVARSSLYRNPPLGDARQPDYVNAVAGLSTRLSPHGLLSALQALEAASGRVRVPARWAPRTLDLDLLLYGSLELGDGRLTIPHPEMTRRPFVLFPLREIAPDLVVPGRGPVAELVTGLSDADLTLVEQGA